MNKIFIVYFLLIILVLSACNPRTLNGKLNLYIKNSTLQTIFSKVEISSRSWSELKISEMFIRQNDSILLTYNSIGIYKSVGITVHKIILYNLVDTTSLLLRNQDFGTYPFNSIINNSWQEYFKEELNKVNILTINNDLLDLFKKDTSMLTKFKDYYNP